MKSLVLPFAVIASLGLAACSDAPDTATTAPTEVAPATDAMAPAPVETPATSTTETPATPVTGAPAGSAMDINAMMPEGAMEALQEQVANMSEADKQEAVAEARRTAEEIARQQGLSDDLIAQVGDQAEGAARELFGLE